MARPLRIEKAGGWYHVSARGNEQKSILRDHRDRQHLLEVIAEMVGRFRVRLHCFALMDNHYHLLLELRETNLIRESRSHLTIQQLALSSEEPLARLSESR